MVKSFYWSSSWTQATEESCCCCLHIRVGTRVHHKHRATRATNSRKTHNVRNSEHMMTDSTERVTTCQRYHYRRYPEDPNDRWTATYLRTYIAQNYT
ncbi:unnamed protein product [Ectocarpus sp. CCAP 1310/34]|nr:unnamed protein product [Ectocarpus sp. CCAP 1310/34]